MDVLFVTAVVAPVMREVVAVRVDFGRSGYMSACSCKVESRIR